MENRRINKHFRRETMMICMFVLSPLIIGTFVGLIYISFQTSGSVDSCLDSGGSYDYQRCTCDFDKNHPYQEVHSCF